LNASASLILSFKSVDEKGKDNVYGVKCYSAPPSFVVSFGIREDESLLILVKVKVVKSVKLCQKLME